MNAAFTVGGQIRSRTEAATPHGLPHFRRLVSVRALGADDWALYRSLLDEVAQDSPELIPNLHDDGSAGSERDWRSRVVTARRLVAEQDGAAVGVVSVRTHRDEPTAADLTALWVAPAARNSGIGTRLVAAAASREAGDGRKQLYYWVETENAPAVAFASNTGFRVTSHRRNTRANDDDQEVAFVMPLEPDPGTVPNASDTP